MIDDAVGRVLDELDAQGERDESLVVYTSDHGLNMAASRHLGQGQWQRTVEYAGGVHPRTADSQSSGLIAGGQIRAELVNHCDLFMSLLDFADATPKALEQIAGKSYRHLLDGGTIWNGTTRRSSSTAMYAPSATRVTNCAAYDGYENLLHDLQQDPRETVNLSRDPQHQNTVKRLTDALGRFFAIYEVAEHSGTAGTICQSITEMKHGEAKHFRRKRL